MGHCMPTYGTVHAAPSSVVKIEMSLVSQSCLVLLESGYGRRRCADALPSIALFRAAGMQSDPWLLVDLCLWYCRYWVLQVFGPGCAWQLYGPLEEAGGLLICRAWKLWKSTFFEPGEGQLWLCWNCYKSVLPLTFRLTDVLCSGSFSHFRWRASVYPHAVMF